MRRFMFVLQLLFFLSGGLLTETESMPAPRSRAVIAFTGDLMVHDRQLENAYRSDTDSYTFTGFTEIAPYLQSADYAVGNLETTFAGREAGYGTYPLFNTPDTFADDIRNAGFDFVSTANNHCYDKGEKGLRRTLEILDEHGIAHAGTYADEAAQRQVFMQDINGIRVAFLSYTYGTNGIPVAEGKPWLVNGLDEELIRSQIEQARSEGAEIIIVLPHMGNEYQEQPPERFQSLAHRFCEWGADAVMASHPHVLQPSEVYTVGEGADRRECFIAYSMGNFISGQRTIPRDCAAIFYLAFERGADTRVRLHRASYTETWVRYRNIDGKYDIEVLPVHKALGDAAKGAASDLRPQDATRMKEAHREISRKMLGQELSVTDLRLRYWLYEAQKPAVGRPNGPRMRTLRA